MVFRNSNTDFSYQQYGSVFCIIYLMNRSVYEQKFTFDQFVRLELSQLKIDITGTENEYGLKYTLYRVQVQHPAIQLYSCSRRYNEFYALHKVLKIKYSNLDLPQFPGKHDLFNRTEKRKQGFYLLLNRLVQIAIEHPQISQNILKLLYFFLTRELTGQEKQSILKSENGNSELKTTIDEDEDQEMAKTLRNAITEEEGPYRASGPEQSKIAPQRERTLFRSLTDGSQITQEAKEIKEIKNYGGNVQMRFSDEEEWVQFYAKIKSGSLFLYNHISQNYFNCQIFLFQSQIEQRDDIIFIRHSYDWRKMQLRLPHEESGKKDKKRSEPLDQTEKSLLNIWLAQLRIASTEALEEGQTEFNPVGKLQINIREVLNLKNIVQDSFLLVRIKFKPFLCTTKHHVYTENPQFRQDFVIPINDSYGVIQLELVNEVQDGLLSRKTKQTVIGTAEIQIADLLSYHSDAKFERLVLDLQVLEEQTANRIHNLFQRKGTLSLDDKTPQIVVTIRNMSSPLSLFAAPPIDSYEGDKLEPNLTLMKMHIIRFKRIISLVAQFALNMEDVVDQKYPRLTLFVFTNLFLFIFFADINYILSYIVFGIILVMIYQHPVVHPILSQFFTKYMLCELNPYYMTPKLFTIEQKDLKKNTMTLDKVIKFENNEIKIEVEEDENEARESLYQKIRAIQKQFFVVQVQMTYFSNFAEKILNLFTWKEYHRTLYFFTIIVIIYCFLRVLPLRYLMLAGEVINEWFDGKVVFKKRCLHNQRIATVMVEYILKRHAPELMKLENQLDQEMPKSEHFRNKMAHELKLHLQVHLTLEEINKYKTANEIILYMRALKQRFNDSF